MTAKKKLNEIKVISGKYRGKVISFDYHDDNQDSHLRPTSNRARETLFNWLMFDVINSNCLDLFAGSGALSFEAISRGAKSVSLIELSSSIYKGLLKIKQSFPKDIDNINVINSDAFQYIKNFHQSDLSASIKVNIFDIIFIDPPYNLINNEFINKLVLEFRNNELINNNSLLYFESDKDLEGILKNNNLLIKKQKKISSVYIYLCSLN